MKTENLLTELIEMMRSFSYPIEQPIKKSFLDSLFNKTMQTETSAIIEHLCDEILTLFARQPDYLTFLKTIDGFEFNGLKMFSLSVPEPLVKNLFVINEFYRNNDNYLNPDLIERLVIGDDSISVFTYDTKTNLFEIRDNIGTKNVFGSFETFSDFLSEILETVR